MTQRRKLLVEQVPAPLPEPGSLKVVRLYGQWRLVKVQPYSERLVRQFGAAISARDQLTSVYRNYTASEFKEPEEVMAAEMEAKRRHPTGHLAIRQYVDHANHDRT